MSWDDEADNKPVCELCDMPASEERINDEWFCTEHLIEVVTGWGTEDMDPEYTAAIIRDRAERPEGPILNAGECIVFECPDCGIAKLSKQGVSHYNGTVARYPLEYLCPAHAAMVSSGGWLMTIEQWTEMLMQEFDDQKFSVWDD